VIDCDPGHDDALALLLAHHLCELVGVTTVSGNAPLADVTANALAILDLLDASVPVHAGARGPLVQSADGGTRHAQHVHGETGLDGSTLPASRRRPDGTDAAGYLIEAAERYADLWLIAIGPLTNVAQALLRAPDFVGRLAGISIMGGASRGGNVTPCAEFNVWADPEAAARVFAAPVPIRLCDLTLTHQLKTSAETLATLERIGTSKSAFAVELLRYLHGRMQTLTGEPRAALHDPCAVLAVTHPELFEFRSLPVQVELHGDLTRGMTVVDERFSGRGRQPLIELATRIDVEAAFALLNAALAE
jgi:inosine-uridine nucleoside N-ribohydrolase